MPSLTHSPSHSPSHKSDDVQTKGLRRIVTKFKRGFRRSIGHHDHDRKGGHAAGPEAAHPFDARVAGVDPPLLVALARSSTIPASAKTTPTAHSFTTSEHDPLGKAHMSDGSSITESQASVDSEDAPEHQSVAPPSELAQPTEVPATSSALLSKPGEMQEHDDAQHTVEEPTTVEEPASTLDSRFDAVPGVALVDLVTPPALTEPEVPDPFFVDSPEHPLSDEDEDSAQAQTGLSIDRPAQDLAGSEITLAHSSASHSPTTLESTLPSVDVNKAMPPPPPSDSSSDEEEESPEVYLPGLIIPTMFLPIPNTDPLSVLLTKYISPEKRPSRDLTGDWQRTDFHTLVMTNSWRALARMARDRIVEADPENLTLILSLWSLRLSSLARLRLFNQTSAECTNLFSVLNAIEPPSARAWVFDRVLPFELEVLYAKLKYWAGDHMGYLDALTAILQKCRRRARRAGADATAVAMWKERGARVCLIVASQLIEMKELAAAAKLLEPLCAPGPGVTVPSLRSAVGRIYLQSGYVSRAATHFATVAEDPSADMSMKTMNAALQASARGDWTAAADALREILASDPENYVAVNDLSVVLLCQGRLLEAIQILEDALKESPSTIVVAEPFLFNLSTLYELRAAAGVEKKRELLIEVAKWSGDGLRTTCLKMPSN